MQVSIFDVSSKKDPCLSATEQNVNSWGTKSGEINELLDLISHQVNIDKTYLYAKDPFEAKHQLLINKRESVGSLNFNDSKAFIEYSNEIDYVYENIDEYNPNKKQKSLIVFDDMIVNIVNN